MIKAITSFVYLMKLILADIMPRYLLVGKKFLGSDLIGWYAGTPTIHVGHPQAHLNHPPYSPSLAHTPHHALPSHINV